MTVKSTLARPLNIALIITFIPLCLLAHILLVPSYIFVRPFNRKIYRKLSYYIGGLQIACFSFVYKLWAKTEVTLYMDKNDYEQYLGKEHALLILNHRSEIDYMTLVFLADHCNVLGNFKCFIKKEILYIPLLGTINILYENISLTRSNDKDKAIIENGAKNLLDFPDPCWLILFAEGTRFSEKKHAEGVTFSRERKLRELKHHLVPRTKGFTTCVPILKQSFPAIYNVELVFSTQQGAPTISALMKGEYIRACFYIKRIPMSDVPDSKTDQERFLRDMFQEKDSLQESFKSTGDFFQTSGKKPLQPIKINPSYLLSIWCLVWFFTCILMFSHNILFFISNSNYVLLSIWIGVLLTLIAIGNKIAAFMEMKKDE